jgi:hypothetical protein
MAKLIARHGTASVCPACSGIKKPDAVFCNHPAGQQALGCFEDALEEIWALAHARPSVRVEKWAGLDYKVNVPTYREIAQMRAMMQQTRDRQEHLE